MSRLARAQGGAAAVEFALVSVPFFLLLMGVIEVGLIFFLVITLDSAVNDAVRPIRTGELQTGGSTPTAASFQASICSRLGWLESQCSANLRTDVRTFPNYGAISLPPPMTGQNYDPSKLNGYVDTPPCAIVVVRAFYKWSLIAPFMNKATQTLSDGSLLFSSTAAFRNEPFTPVAGGATLC